ncbi:ribonuclease P protein component [Subtercola sp. YIM 133946]|uniref:ribonuclease P protein component n=1 Tax=Subtercola sp. YIM 133946 TaxID=3118909 RepID=UPI002F93AEDC
MLAQQFRVTTADEYRAAVRRGARFVSANTVTYVLKGDGSQNDGRPRFGFIVSKQVGIAVVRNRVRRRLKAAGYELLPSVTAPADVVVRVLPAGSTASYAQFASELRRSLAKAGMLA